MIRRHMGGLSYLTLRKQLSSSPRIEQPVLSTPRRNNMDRSYEEAIRCLNSRKPRPNPNRVLDDMRGSDDMLQWLEILGHSVEDLNRLNPIHVAGTNGKGSTCAFTASILKVYGNETGYPRKIGLYTSPHVRSIRERIQINGESISKRDFTTRFFELWDKLPLTATETLDIPRYLQFLALLSFHTFIEEKVDVAIIETHLGGQYDATNIIPMPLVTAITTISMDHIHLLGPTIEKIAIHKAGIFKYGRLAFSALQLQEVTTVLQEQASMKKVPLTFVGIDPHLPTELASLYPKVQKSNCSLALAIVRAWLSLKAPDAGVSDRFSKIVTQGICEFSWPGRYQRIYDRKCEWFLDGAHNESGLQHAVEWFAGFANKSHPPPPLILIFAHFSSRDGTVLLRTIAASLQDSQIQMQHIIFTTYDERRDGHTRIDRNQKNSFSQKTLDTYVETWRQLAPAVSILCGRTIEEALDKAREIGKKNGMQTLVTGSLHLVSGALYLLETDHLKEPQC